MVVQNMLDFMGQAMSTVLPLLGMLLQIFLASAAAYAVTLVVCDLRDSWRARRERRERIEGWRI